MPPSITLVDIAVVLLGLYLVKRLLSPRQPAPLPPGPKGLPIIGNALDFPTQKEWLVFREWGQTWGDIMSVSAVGKVFIIVNSAQIAHELLNKRSTKYSDRPVLQFGGEMCGWKESLPLLQYTERHRRYRKIFHRFIGTPAALKEFLPIEEQETHKFLRRLLSKPHELVSHVRHNVGAIILKISHGYEVEEHDDPFIALADRAAEQFCKASAPGAYMVDFIPALKYLPSWMPGAGFKETAKIFIATAQEIMGRPYNLVKERMDAGTAPFSAASTLIEEGGLDEESVHEIKWCSSSLYGAGADTTVAAIYSLFLAMALYPDVQRRAQEEIARVVGSDRLPTFADRELLPYVNALSKEVLRWHVVAPFGAPHCSSEDDVYQGYVIPKGSIVIVNIWGILQDPRYYPDPGKFDPTRHLGENPQIDPYEICFGFGRRICPGQHLVDASVFISCAMSLAVFNIGKAVENGVVVEPVHEQMAGLISHPLPYKCDIALRSAKAEALILSEH